MRPGALTERGNNGALKALQRTTLTQKELPGYPYVASIPKQFEGTMDEAPKKRSRGTIPSRFGYGVAVTSLTLIDIFSETTQQAGVRLPVSEISSLTLKVHSFFWRISSFLFSSLLWIPQQAISA